MLHRVSGNLAVDRCQDGWSGTADCAGPLLSEVLQGQRMMETVQAVALVHGSFAETI